MFKIAWLRGEGLLAAGERVAGAGIVTAVEEEAGVRRVERRECVWGGSACIGRRRQRQRSLAVPRPLHPGGLQQCHREVGAGNLLGEGVKARDLAAQQCHQRGKEQRLLLIEANVQ
jgi:hypothetical protein